MKHPLLLIGICLCSLILSGQNQRPNQESHQLPIRRSTSEIKVDGILDEAPWDEATIATDFWEKDPRDGILAPVKTEARVTYDDQFLYVSMVCHDTSSNHIVQTRKRDAGYWDSDAIAVTLDPFNEATNGFMFGINPEGAQMEALLGGGSGDGNWNNNWDNIWFAETSVHADYWIVEMAIPFKTLRYDAGSTGWGINFLRNDPKRNMFHVWAPIPRQFWGIDQGYSGKLVWDAPPPVAKGNIALIPYASVATTQDLTTGDMSVFDVQPQIGADAKVALSPSLNLDLTVNPDFSQVDVDVQQTNLTRFNLFFPERRNFFLENSDLFANFGIPSGRPFFSRRIGLTESGEAVPINFGARITGNVTDDLRIGILNAQTKELATNPGQNYFTAAASQRVFQRSSIRAMFTNRQAYSGGEFSNTDYNRNADLEFQYQSADGSLIGWAGYHHSMREGFDTDRAWYNVGGGYTGANLNFFVDYVDMGRNYYADVGFVNRIDNYDAARDTTVRRGYKILFMPLNFTLLPKTDWIQNFNIELVNAVFLQEDYSFNERESTLLFTIERPNSSRIIFGASDYEVDLLFPFSFVNNGEPLPAQRYRYQDWGFVYSTDERKALGWEGRVEQGTFFNGKRLQVASSLTYRAQPWGNFSVDAEYNRLRFPDAFGETELWLVGPRAEINFSRNLFWTTFLQYNTQADNFNINSRLQWQFRPLSWLFLVYSDNYAVDVWGPKNRGVVLKMNYWFTI